MRKLVLLVAFGLLASLALATCGGGDDNETTAQTTNTQTTTQAGGGGGGGSATVSLSADPSGALAYQEKSLTAQAGNSTIDFDNPAPLGHDVCVEDSSGKQLGCSDVVTDDTSSLTLNLKSGTYTYYCSVDEHRAGGMEGTLTVQ
ncbi:MAG TPA: plastocyanin/azurin family copper-binding protein [Solirubrobacterales bacterium]|nr:plastocyanin/azurin family copper-binding protein [Solirubrobacterales bacterium]